ncbi:MAG: PAS domain S-box protein [bacterium]
MQNEKSKLTASDIDKYKWMEQELYKYQQHLEELVQQRTKELTISNEFLKKKISTHRRAEEALRELEAKYSVLAEQARDGVAIIQDGRFTFVNRPLTYLTGYAPEELFNKFFLEIIEPEHRNLVSRIHTLLLRGEKISPVYEAIIKCKNGTLKDIEVSSGTIQYHDNAGIMEVIHDITEHKNIEEKLQKFIKLESLSALSGGIAHDFSNILTVILSSIALAKKRYTKSGDELYVLFIKIEKSALRAKELIYQLLNFSRDGVPIKSTDSIIKLIKESANFAVRGSNIRCEFFILEDLWQIEINEEKISQLINNLIINAKQTLTTGGIIKVYAKNIIIRSEDSLPLLEGGYVKISINYEGAGISEEYLLNIFGPYSFDKNRNESLGYATTYYIIKKCNGYITVSSKAGKETTFSIYLPIDKNRFEVKEIEISQEYRGEGKVLFMDDEEEIRIVAGELIKSLGYEVELAKDGEETIELYIKAKKEGNQFRAVIMDLTIPGSMGGREAIKRLLEIDPHVNAIVSSGYSNDPIISNFKHYGFRSVIIKPYIYEELSKVLFDITHRSK